MYEVKSEKSPTDYLKVLVGLAGLGLALYLFFGDFIRSFGFGNVVLYFITPLILVILWRGYSNLNASHNELCKAFRNLRAEVEKLKSNSK